MLGSGCTLSANVLPCQPGSSGVTGVCEAVDSVGVVGGSFSGIVTIQPAVPRIKTSNKTIVIIKLILRFFIILNPVLIVA
jgi:hypothetical protein